MSDNKRMIRVSVPSEKYESIWDEGRYDRNYKKLKNDYPDAVAEEATLIGYNVKSKSQQYNSDWDTERYDNNFESLKEKVKDAEASPLYSYSPIKEPATSSYGMAKMLGKAQVNEPVENKSSLGNVTGAINQEGGAINQGTKPNYPSLSDDAGANQSGDLLKSDMQAEVASPAIQQGSIVNATEQKEESVVDKQVADAKESVESSLANKGFKPFGEFLYDAKRDYVEPEKKEKPSAETEKNNFDTLSGELSSLDNDIVNRQNELEKQANELEAMRSNIDLTDKASVDKYNALLDNFQKEYSDFEGVMNKRGELFASIEGNEYYKATKQRDELNSIDGEIQSLRKKRKSASKNDKDVISRRIKMLKEKKSLLSEQLSKSPYIRMQDENAAKQIDESKAELSRVVEEYTDEEGNSVGDFKFKSISPESFVLDRTQPGFKAYTMSQAANRFLESAQETLRKPYKGDNIAKASWGSFKNTIASPSFWSDGVSREDNQVIASIYKKLSDNEGKGDASQILDPLEYQTFLAYNEMQFAKMARACDVSMAYKSTEGLLDMLKFISKDVVVGKMGGNALAKFISGKTEKALLRLLINKAPANIIGKTFRALPKAGQFAMQKGVSYIATSLGSAGKALAYVTLTPDAYLQAQELSMPTLDENGKVVDNMSEEEALLKSYASTAGMMYAFSGPGKLLRAFSDSARTAGKALNTKFFDRLHSEYVRKLGMHKFSATSLAYGMSQITTPYAFLKSASYNQLLGLDDNAINNFFDGENFAEMMLPMIPMAISGFAKTGIGAARYNKFVQQERTRYVYEMNKAANDLLEAGVDRQTIQLIQEAIASSRIKVGEGEANFKENTQALDKLVNRMKAIARESNNDALNGALNGIGKLGIGENKSDALNRTTKTIIALNNMLESHYRVQSYLGGYNSAVLQSERDAMRKAIEETTGKFHTESKLDSAGKYTKNVVIEGTLTDGTKVFVLNENLETGEILCVREGERKPMFLRREEFATKDEGLDIQTYSLDEYLTMRVIADVQSKRSNYELNGTMKDGQKLLKDGKEVEVRDEGNGVLMLVDAEGNKTPATEQEVSEIQAMQAEQTPYGRAKDELNRLNEVLSSNANSPLMPFEDIAEIHIKDDGSMEFSDSLPNEVTVEGHLKDGRYFSFDTTISELGRLTEEIESAPLEDAQLQERYAKGNEVEVIDNGQRIKARVSYTDADGIEYDRPDGTIGEASWKELSQYPENRNIKKLEGRGEVSERESVENAAEAAAQNDAISGGNSPIIAENDRISTERTPIVAEGEEVTKEAEQDIPMLENGDVDYETLIKDNPEEYYRQSIQEFGDKEMALSDLEKRLDDNKKAFASAKLNDRSRLNREIKRLEEAIDKIKQDEKPLEETPAIEEALPKEELPKEEVNEEVDEADAVTDSQPLPVEETKQEQSVQENGESMPSEQNAEQETLNNGGVEYVYERKNWDENSDRSEVEARIAELEEIRDVKNWVKYFPESAQMNADRNNLIEKYGSKENIPGAVVEEYSNKYSNYINRKEMFFEELAELNELKRKIDAAEEAKRSKELEEKKAEENKALLDSFNGFLADKGLMNAKRISGILNKKYNFGDKGTMTVAELIESLHKEGKLTVKKEEGVPEISRVRWNRMTGEEQEEWNKKRVTSYYVSNYDLGKTAYDYAEFLLKNDLKPKEGVAGEVNGNPANGQQENPTVAAIQEARQEVNTEPTEAQKKAGNYRKGHLKIDGYDISIENPKGSMRRGTDSEGEHWETEMQNDYGYIRGTESVDGDHIDVYLSDNPSEGKVFVIDQVNPKTGEFDEHKVMYGFADEQSARDAYLSNYAEGWQGLGNISEVSKEEFSDWIKSSKRKTKPFTEYKVVDDLRAKRREVYDSVNEGDVLVDANGGTIKILKKYPNYRGYKLDISNPSFGGIVEASLADLYYRVNEEGYKIAEKPAESDSGIAKQVNVEGLMNTLSTTGQAKPSDFAEGIPQATDQTENNNDGRIVGVAPKVKSQLNLFKYVVSDKDPNKSMTGVYHDKGMQVASDGHILVATKMPYPSEMEGAVTDKDGKIITTSYPKWTVVVNRSSNADNTNINPENLAAFINGVKNVLKARYPNARDKIIRDHARIKLCNYNGDDIYFAVYVLDKFVDAARTIGGPIRIARVNPKVFNLTSKNGDDVVVAINVQNIDGLVRYFDYQSGYELDRNNRPIDAEGNPIDNGNVRYQKANDKKLIAVHNLSEKDITEAFELGGFPMPSIAITKADVGHTNFGEISLVFEKTTIDPKSRNNKVYSEDAWTPSFPKIEYKINADKAGKIYGRAANIGDLPMFNPTNFYPSNYENNIEDLEGKSLVEHFRNDYGAKQFFLAEHGNPVTEYETKTVDKYNDQAVARFKELLKSVGLEKLKQESREISPETVQVVRDFLSGGLIPLNDDALKRVARKYVLNAIDYAENGNKKQETDIDATHKLIDDRIDQTAYEKWLEDMFSGIVEKRGIRNQTDMFTPTGNRRAWESLYDDITLDNIVKAMSKAPEKGGSGIFNGSIFGAAAGEFKSIDEIRAAAQERIKSIEPTEMEKDRQAIIDRLSKVKVTEKKLGIGELLNLTDNIKDAVAKSHTPEGIHKYLKEYYPDMTMQAAQEIADIVKDIQKLSTKYFEAKPYRAVGFDEVKLAVVPEGTSQDVIDNLRQRGIEVRTYETGNQQQRKEIVEKATSELSLRFQKSGDRVVPMSEGEVALRDALVERMRSAGISVSTDAEEGQRVLDAVNGNMNDLKITDNAKFFKTPDGKAYGFELDGKIYIDNNIAGADTPIHEYSHLWASAFRKANPAEWKNVVELMKGTEFWEKVKKEYPDLKTDEDIADEVLAQYSGSRGAERLRQEQKKILEGEGSALSKATSIAAIEKVKQALKKFWKGIADWFNIKFTTAEEVADKVLSDLLNRVDPTKTTKAEEVRKEETAIVERAKDDGTYLKAPNGQPTKLSPRQWTQARTRAFKKWFGDWELGAKVLNIVPAIKEHGFKNFNEAKSWAKENIVRTLSNEETGGKGEIRISNNAVSKFLSESSLAKSDSKDVHLSVLKVLPEVIKESIDAEQHPDYKKGEDGKRIPENGVNENVTIHRLYSAVNVDGKDYRVKVTLKEDRTNNEAKKAYNYEATKIELLAGQTENAVTFSRNSNNSITVAKLLNGVEKSYSPGEKLLDYSKVVDENGEPKVVYHGTDAEFYQFDPSKNDPGYHGFYFSDERDVAATYTGTDMVMPVFLNIRDAYELDTEGANWSHIKEIIRADKNDVIGNYRNWKIIIDKMSHADEYKQWCYKIALKYLDEYDRLQAEKPTSALGQKIKQFKTAILLNKMRKAYTHNPTVENTFSTRQFDKNRLLDYGSAIFYNLVDNGGRKITPKGNNPSTVYVVTSPNQIKSATENVGLFDPENPDIRYQFVGEIGVADNKAVETKEPTLFSEELSSEPTEVLTGGTSREEILKGIEDISNSFGVDIVVHEEANLEGKYKNANGWFVTSDGKVHLNMSRFKNVGQAIATAFHEIVGHKGLREMFGEEFGTFIDNVYKNVEQPIREQIDKLQKEMGYNDSSLATEEYLSRLAERGPMNDAEMSVWRKVKNWIVKQLRKIGFNMKLTEADLRAVLQESADFIRKKYGKKRGAMENASSIYHLENAKEDAIASHSQMSAMETSRKEPKPESEVNDVSGNDVLFSMGSKYRELGGVDRQLIDKLDKASYNPWDRLMESVVDKTQIIQKGQQMISDWTGKPMKDKENVSLAIRSMSSKFNNGHDKFMKEVFEPMRKNLYALEKFIGERLGTKNADEITARMNKYLFLKSGLERQEYMAKREALKLLNERIDKEISMLDPASEEYPDMLENLEMIRKQESELIKQGDRTQQDYQVTSEREYAPLRTWFEEFVDPKTNEVLDKLPERMNGESKQSYYARVKKFIKSPKGTLEEIEARAKEYVDDIEGSFGQDKVSALWDSIKKATSQSIETQYKYGLITKERRDDIVGMYDFYLPMRGFQEETAEDINEYLRRPNGKTYEQTLLAAKGRISKPESPYGYIGSMFDSSLYDGVKNDVFEALYRFVANRPDNGAVKMMKTWYVRDENTREWKIAEYPELTDNMTREEVGQVMEQFEAEMQSLKLQKLATQDRAKVSMLGGTLGREFEKEANKFEHIVRGYHNGEQYDIIFYGNPRMAQEINGDVDAARSTNVMVRGYEQFLRFFSRCVTSLNPEFAIGTNLQRDALWSVSSQFIQYGLGSMAKLVKNIVPAVQVVGLGVSENAPTTEKTKQYYKEYVEKGGPTGIMQLTNRKEFEKLVKDNFAKDFNYDKKIADTAVKAGKTYVNFLEGFEQIFRLASYMTARESGKTIEASIADAKNITINFDRKGTMNPISWEEAGRIVNRYYDYENARNGRSSSVEVNTKKVIVKSLLVAISNTASVAKTLIPFTNAAISAVATQAKYATDKKTAGRFWALAASVTGLSLLVSILPAMLLSDDDDDKGENKNANEKYKRNDLSMYMRTSKAVLDNPNDLGETSMFWSLPQEFIPFVGLGDAIGRVMIGQYTPEQAFKQGYQTAVENLNPIGLGDVFTNSPFIGTAIAIQRNKNYQGVPISKESDFTKDKPNWTKGTDYTWDALTDLCKVIAFADSGTEYSKPKHKALDWNPANIQYAVTSTLGGVWDFGLTTFNLVTKAVNGEEVSVSDVPIIRRWVRSNDKSLTQGGISDNYYYWLDRAQRLSEGRKKLETGGVDSEQADILTSDKDFVLTDILKVYEPIIKQQNDIIKTLKEINAPQSEIRDAYKFRDKIRKDFVDECYKATGGM